MKNFRNYEELSIVLDPGTNILYGDNAQGKTNVLEAVYLCGTTKSHRGSKDKEMILFEQDESHIRMMVKKDGQIAPVYSISAGLDYPGVGPEHAHLYDTGRAEYVPVTDDEAVDAFEYLSKVEGIIPAIESAHAVAYAKKLVPTMGKDQIVVITISGRGDKDCAAIARYRGEDIHE